MDQSQGLYAKDTTIRLIETFRSVFGDYFKSYWEATPSEVPPATDYPALIVQKLDGKAVIGPTSTDDITETFAISVWLNKADDAGSYNARTTTMRKLQYLVEGQDPVTNDYKNDTILYVLRYFLTLESWLLDSDTHIRYSQVPQKDMPSIAIADITYTTQRRVMVGRTAAQN